MPKSNRSAKGKPRAGKLERSSGNVFVDLGYSPTEATNLTLRSQLMLVIKETIQERGWTQQQAAKELDIHQPRVSDLMKGALSEFSLDALVCFVQKLGFDVQLILQNKDAA